MNSLFKLSALQQKLPVTNNQGHSSLINFLWIDYILPKLFLGGKKRLDTLVNEKDNLTIVLST